MNNSFDNHHILPRSKWWSSNKNNIIRLDTKYHRNLHQLFLNRTPIEQIEKILSIRETALTDDVKNDIRRILTMDDLEYFYNKGVRK